MLRNLLGGVISLLALLFAYTAHAKTIEHYAQLREQLFSGVQVTAIFTPQQCKNAASPTPVPLVSGGFTIRDFMEVAGANIGFANQHLTVEQTAHDGAQSDDEAVLELIQYRVKPDDTGAVTVTFLSPVTYQPIPKKPKQIFSCAIGQGLAFLYQGR